ncbi:hypothetical protein CJU94_02025 [Paraburkholderia aromaticivorans]|uniref:Uncharacterized protein n=1 Tax=Paraburkholderia aromaticivorans TaxID=2026199 RepID=A0A248VDA5_9BURK|nr:hypothetical protein CJU94_02025 [Paraburkholderia aromaticivorans]
MQYDNVQTDAYVRTRNPLRSQCAFERQTDPNPRAVRERTNFPGFWGSTDARISRSLLPI